MWKPNLLFSYYYFTLESITAWKPYRGLFNEIILDSGAFTAFNVGIKIDLKTYTKDALEMKKFLDINYLVQLDVINNPKKTLENFKKQKECGFCPVITLGQDIDKSFKDAEMLFCGGIVTASKQSKDWFLNKLDVNKQKVHLLGVSNPVELVKYKPYSGDSTNNYSHIRFGQITLYKGGGKFLRCNLNEFVRERKVYEFCKKYDMLDFYSHYVEFYKTENACRKLAIELSPIAVFSQYLYAYELEKRYGIKMFFAIVSTGHEHDFVNRLYVKGLRRFNKVILGKKEE